MLKEQREAEIVRLLANAQAGALRVSHLSEMLGVSEMTVRRDLVDLEQRGLVRRIHGGAMHISNTLLLEKSFNDRGREHQAEKTAIGREAARYVKDGDVIIIDAGTTTLQVARHIQARNITAVTNALPVATELAGREGVSAILLGGNLKGPELCTVGPIATNSLSQMAADLLFLSAAGFSLERGLTDPDLREAEVKRAMMKAARQVILVCDSSKYQLVNFAHIAPLNSINTLITDAGVPLEAQQAMRTLGIHLVLATL